MPRPGAFLDLVGPRFQLLGLDHEQITTRIDANIVELRRLLAQLLDCFHVLFKLPGIGRVDFIERNTRLTIWQGENR